MCESPTVESRLVILRFQGTAGFELAMARPQRTGRNEGPTQRGPRYHATLPPFPTPLLLHADDQGFTGSELRMS